MSNYHRVHACAEEYQNESFTKSSKYQRSDLIQRMQLVGPGSATPHEKVKVPEMFCPKNEIFSNMLSKVKVPEIFS